MFKDQQEAEKKKKVQSQEIQHQEKRKDVMENLAQVEPAVINAQAGKIPPMTLHCFAILFSL